MLRSEKKSEMAAAAVGGRTARVCESCLCKRARWFCAADDAFLCQTCDVSVHSANQLARRHDRIRLETASFKKTTHRSHSHLPPWPNAFTRKARTPRPNKHLLSTKASVFSLVPQIGNNDDGLFIDDNEQDHNVFPNHQQVPVFDPFDDDDDEKLLFTDELEDFGDGFLPSEVDLAEFVADVETLLGKQQQQEEETDQSRLLKFIKNEEHEDFLDWEFKGQEIDEEDNKTTVPIIMAKDEVKCFQEEFQKKKIFLRLNYDAVITAWDAQSSPYTTGNRPQLDLDDDCWEEWIVQQNGERGGALEGRGEWKNNGEREARVSRYREKRRTRLFSKKIRYQVRKLNAEKRPRLKGRFVKRTTTPFII